MNLKVKVIEVELYHTELYLYVGPNPEACKAISKDFLILAQPSSANGGFMMELSKEDSVVYLVWVSSLNKKDLGYLVHEMLHASIAILRNAGLSLGPKSEEAYTYLTEFLFNKALS